MALIILYPAVAVLTLFIVLIIMVMLSCGPKICGLRHTALPYPYDEEEEGYEDQAYDHKVSEA